MGYCCYSFEYTISTLKIYCFRGNNKGVGSGVSGKKREPRRHTLQNGIDQSMVSGHTICVAVNLSSVYANLNFFSYAGFTC